VVPVGTAQSRPPWEVPLRFLPVEPGRSSAVASDPARHEGAGLQLELVGLGPLDRALELAHDPSEDADADERELLAATTVVDGSRVIAALATDVDALAGRWPAATLTRAAGPALPGLRALLASLEQPVPILLAGSPLRRRVLVALGRLPLGEVVTYGDLAGAVGAPRAVRAVASMVAANPVPVLLGCHRVVPAAGGTGAYVWGSTVKQRLLVRERTTLPASSLHAPVRADR
jgi:O-6-methylguanine DNA methyltransferase